MMQQNQVGIIRHYIGIDSSRQNFVCQKVIPNCPPPSGRGEEGVSSSNKTEAGSEVQVAICGNIFYREK